MTDFFAQVNGIQAHRLSITMPYYGIWEGDIELVTPNTITNPISLVIGNLTLAGAIYRYSSFAGTTYLRLVGGAAGWRQSVPSQAYANPASTGIKASTILRDVATIVGEQVNIAQDSTIGNFYVVAGRPAQYILGLIGGSEWYVDANGVTQVGPRPTANITSQFTVIDANSGKGWYNIATEDYASWIPGNTFSSPTVPVAQTISSVRFDCGNDGIARLKVLVQ